MAHFPPDRNFLHAHLTMFHRLPGEYEGKILDDLVILASRMNIFKAEITGLRHLGAGVAFLITSSELQDIRGTLKAKFISWLGSQDMQNWQPHITVQNKASKAKADALYRHLSNGFAPYLVEIDGLDLWEYLGGPWKHQGFAPFKSTT